MKERYSVPIAWTTDVNAATYGEYKKGNGKVRTSVLVSESGVGQLLITGY
jgi:fructokinase